MTIAERAKEIADKFRAQSYFDNRCNDLVGNIAYQVAIICLTEQKKIDIDKAWEWITEACSKYPITKEELPILEQSFYKAIEGNRI